MSKKYLFKKDYEEPLRELYPREYIPERGITKVIAPEIPVFERFKSTQHYKDAYNMCVKCGQCRSVFREAFLSPICPSGELRRFESYYAGGKNLLLWGLTRGRLKPTKEIAEIFYHCTLCGNCQQQCQIPEMHLWLMDWLEAFREEAVKMGIGPMPEQEAYGRHVEKEHNPYMEPHKDRLNWLPFDKEKLPRKAEILYLVGCTSAYREKDVAKAMTEVLEGLNLDFTIMEDEWCCGSPLMRTGQTERALQCAKHNIDEIKKYGAKLIVTSCAGCYRMLKEDYKKRFNLEYDFEVLHTPSFLLTLVKENKLKLGEVKKKVAYHDPCHIGRHMGIYSPPRDLLQSVPGLELVEMLRNKHDAWCCGSGAGVKSAFKELALFAADERLREAEETGAEILTTACPFCELNFKDALSTYERKLEILDVVQLVRMAMKK